MGRISTPPTASALRRVCALPAAWKTREQTTIADRYPYYGQPAEAPEK